MLRLRARVTCVALCLVMSYAAAAGAQSQSRASQPAQAPPGTVSATGSVERAEPYTFTYFNRPIVVFRARLFGRGPQERALAASSIVDNIVAEQITGPVESRPFDGGIFIVVGPRVVLALTSFDVDELSGETLQNLAAQTSARVQLMLQEAVESRRPGVLLRATGLTGVALVLTALALWGLARAHRRISRKLIAEAEARVARTRLVDVEALRATRVFDLQRYMVATAFTILNLFVVYTALTFALRRFPFTRPWGESMRNFLISTIQNIALGIAAAMPGLFTVVVIFAIARFAVRLGGLWFQAIERGSIQPRFIYPETAQTTRRLVSTLIWLFAIVMAYPYMPGSQSEAFKGVSVFVGLMVTFGSSGIVNQIMSGFMITYSRSLRLGDFVRIGDVEGTVIHLGVLSTKVRTLRREEVTIPNAVVVSQTTTDFSRNADAEGVLTPTSVTIGYDAPWRQVQAMLLQAAERTPGIRRQPNPLVLQAGLEDFYVKYTLLVSLERQDQRAIVLTALHANIQDVFNEYGVQIMSPNYVLDPAAPKVVPKKDWFAAPAPADKPAVKP